MAARSYKKEKERVVIMNAAPLRQTKLTAVESNYKPPSSRQPASNFKDMTGLVGAGSLDVAGLLALVADTLVGRLGRAVAGQVANLAAYNTVRAVACHEWEGYLQL